MKYSDWVDPPRPSDWVVWLIGGMLSTFLASTAVYSATEQDLVGVVVCSVWCGITVLLTARDWRRVKHGAR